ncbi:putative hlh dna binding protein [Phaeomoniella chlamydospora]|uniref:Putative hlh dna binding protein n=1 Tax=Phaeomoniella chlamydospora TaxID=158046 RepID=A0A0G2GQT4_PHACM|nr:putative hlh dna binding protein [Phaeomoniella chlamydospora]
MADQSINPTAALPPEGYTTLPSNKRKREDNDQDDGGRGVRSHANGDSTPVHNQEQIQQQLLQAIGQSNGVQDDDTARTAQAALATPMATSSYPAPDHSYDPSTHGLSYGDDPNQSPPAGLIGSTAHALYAAREASSPLITSKPAVGTPQWHQQRKDNHKEVERRRRETINDGINEIAKIVPGCEKNKGSILQRAVSYINELVMERNRWHNDRGTLDAAVKELAFRFDKMKESAEQAWVESAKWQKRCRDAGLQFDDYDDPPVGDTLGQSEHVPAE